MNSGCNVYNGVDCLYQLFVPLFLASTNLYFRFILRAVFGSRGRCFYWPCEIDLSVLY